MSVSEGRTTMQVIDPRGVMPMPTPSGDRWQLDVRGKTIGILWNGKPNADNLLRVIERRLRSSFGIADTIWVDKLADGHGPALPATEAMFDKLSAGAVAVLAASGD
jgi:hypothetical protein